MRILHSIRSVNPEGGGPIEVINQLAPVQRAAGHSVQIVSLDAPQDRWVTECPVPVIALGPGHGRFGYSPRLVPWLRRRAKDYDAVIVNGIWEYHGFGVFRALRSGAVPYFVFPHGMLDPWFKRTYPLKHLKKWLYWPWAGYPVLRRARAVCFTCEEERLLARESFWLYRCTERVVTLGTAAPTGDPLAQTQQFFLRYPDTHGKRLILFLGRIHPKKGCDLLIRAFAQVVRERGPTSTDEPALHLVMAGPDVAGWWTDLAALAASLGVSEHITWTGMLSGDIKFGALRAAEIFALPSHQENFGIAVAEALACATPVLISDKVNIWREVEQDGAGLVAPDDEAGTLRSLRGWLSKPEHEQRAFRARAQACFARRFEIQKATESLLQVLESTAEPVGPAPPLGLIATDSKPETRRYPALDLIRAVAALAVAGSHWRNLFFQDYDKLQLPSLFGQAFYFLGGLGHQAVIVFFVLSGFVISNSIHASIEKGSWSWRNYLVSRLTRLWIVLIPAILLGVLLDHLGVATLQAGGIYSSAGFGHILLGTEPDQLGLAVIGGNMLFLQTILVPTVGSNSPLWSLANEFWYYLTFPILLLAYQRGQSAPRRVGYTLAGLAILALAGPAISQYFVIWLMGCAVFYSAPALQTLSQKAARQIFWLGGVLIMAFLFATRSHRWVAIGDFGQDFILGLAVALTLFGAAKLLPAAGTSMWGRISLALAQPSYSLYLLHLPFLVFVASRLFASNSDRWAPDLRHLVYGLGIGTVCALYVGALYRLTDANTGRVRRWVLRGLAAAWPVGGHQAQNSPQTTRSLS
jgi:glycosyltransferase involved in cell wall biosynthesis/peptidoglycan/LPS O-acetylase OafA/YrhL